MEAQPVSLLLQVGARLLESGPPPWPLSFPQSDWLAFLGELLLLWWAWAVETWTGSQPDRTRWRAFALLLSLLLALLSGCGLLLPRLLAGQDLALGLLVALLLVWLWRRALTWSRLGFEHEALARSFRLSFLLLLAILGLALLASWQDLQAALALAWPLFFFSGLLTLSLARLSALRRQPRAQGLPGDPLRPWLLVSVLLSLLILLLVALLEMLFSFTTFQTLVAWLTPGLARLWDWLSEGLLWLLVLLLTPFFDLAALIVAALQHGGRLSAPGLLSPARLHQQLQRPASGSGWLVPPAFLLAGRLLVLFLLVLALLWMVRRLLRLGHWRAARPEVDEEREMLNPLKVLGERRRARGRERASSLAVEALPPTSLRWLYRAWLEALAARDQRWVRHPAETALEYLERLRRQLGHGEMTKGEPELSEFGEHLTRAYLEERYGNRPPSPERLRFLRQRWERLAVRLRRQQGLRSQR